MWVGDRLSAFPIWLFAAAPPWHGVQPSVPTQDTDRYALLPLRGFALLWHQTLPQFPLRQCSAAWIVSVPLSVPPLYVGAADPPVYGFVEIERTRYCAGVA